MHQHSRAGWLQLIVDCVVTSMRYSGIEMRDVVNSRPTILSCATTVLFGNAISEITKTDRCNAYVDAAMASMLSLITARYSPRK